MTKLSHSYSSLKMFYNCPLRYYRQRIIKDIKDVMGEASLYGVRVHEHLEHRIKHNTPLPPDCASYEPLCAAFESQVDGGELIAEKEATLNKGLKPTGWWDDDAWLRSKLDILVLNGENALIADWKTGKRRVDFDQFEMFALQVFAHYPQIEAVKTMFIWLKPMKKDSRVYVRAQVGALWRDLMVRIRRVEKALETNNWPAKPSGLCPWCPAFEECPHK